MSLASSQLVFSSGGIREAAHCLFVRAAKFAYFYFLHCGMDRYHSQLLCGIENIAKRPDMLVSRAFSETFFYMLLRSKKMSGKHAEEVVSHGPYKILLCSAASASKNFTFAQPYCIAVHCSSP